MKKYSKVYKISGFSLRYNYQTNEIECFDEDYGVLDSIGCYLEDWEENPKGMCEKFAEELNEELEYIM